MRFYRIINTAAIEISLLDFDKADKTFYTLDDDVCVFNYESDDYTMLIKDVFDMAEKGIFLKEDLHSILTQYERNTSIPSIEFTKGS